MKKVVRNNKTFLINEELYKKLKKNASYLIEDEEPPLPGFENPENEKSEENPKQKTKKELEREKKIKKKSFDLLYNSIFKAKCLQLYSRYRDILIKNSENIKLPEGLKNISIEEYIKAITDSRKLYNRFINRVAEKIENEDETHAGLLFLDEFNKIIKDKRFIMSTVQKTLQSMKQQPKLDLDTPSDVTSNPMSESLLYEDENGNNDNSDQEIATELTKYVVDTNISLIQNNKNNVANKMKDAPDANDILSLGQENNEDNKNDDSSIKEKVNKLSMTELLVEIEKIPPINPIDYSCLESLKIKMNSINDKLKNPLNAGHEETLRDAGEDSIKTIISDYLIYRNNAIRELKKFKSKITENNCMAFIKNYFPLKSDNSEINYKKYNSKEIKNIMNKFNPSNNKIDGKNEDEDVIANILATSLVELRQLENIQFEKLKSEFNKTKDYNESINFDYYEYSKILFEENEKNAFLNIDEFDDIINIEEIIRNDILYTYGVFSILDSYVNKIIIRIFNTPEMSSLSKKIKNLINNKLSELEQSGDNKLSMEESIRKAIKYIGTNDISIETYEEKYNYALEILDSMGEIITKSIGELSSELAIFDPLHYVLINGDLLGTIKKVCEDDSKILQSLRELYGYALLTKICDKNKKEITSNKSLFKKLNNKKMKLSELIVEIAERCQQSPIEDIKNIKDIYSSKIQGNSVHLITEQMIMSMVRIISIHNEKQRVEIIDAIRQNNDIKSGYDVTQGYMVGVLGQPLLRLTFTKNEKFYGTIVFMNTFGTFKKMFGAWNNKMSIANSFRKLLRI